VFDLHDLPENRFGDWRDYARGVLFELRDAGVPLHGACLRVSSTVPLGGGLSSSASFEVALALALVRAAGRTMDALPLAALAQRAENGYTGTRSGVMDQMAVLFG